MNKDSYIYIEKLAYDFGLFDLPKEKQNTILKELNNAFEERLLSSILDKLNNKDKLKLEKLSETDNSEEIFNFLMENIEDINEIMDAVYLGIRKELLSSQKS